MTVYMTSHDHDDKDAICQIGKINAKGRPQGIATKEKSLCFDRARGEELREARNPNKRSIPQRVIGSKHLRCCYSLHLQKIYISIQLMNKSGRIQAREVGGKSFPARAVQVANLLILVRPASDLYPVNVLTIYTSMPASLVSHLQCDYTLEFCLDWASAPCISDQTCSNFAIFFSCLHLGFKDV
jgi:hypothetical protein